VLRQVRLIIPYVKRYRGELYQGILTLVAASVVSAAIPYLIKLAVDALREGFSRTVIRIILVTALLVLGQAVLKSRARMKILNSSREIEFELRRDFYAHLVSLPYGFFRDHHRGDLIARMMTDAGNVRMMVSMMVLHFSNTITTTVLSLVMMFRLSPSITLLSVIPLCFLFLLMRAFVGRLHRVFTQIQKINGYLSKDVNEVLSGIRVVKNYLLEGEEGKRFDALNADYMEKTLAGTRVWGLLFPLTGFLGGVGTLIVMWMGGSYLIEHRITLGAFIALNTYYMMLMWPIAALGWVLNLYQRGVASLQRIEAIYESEAERTGGIVPASITGAIAFDRVGVVKEGRQVLKNVSFSLQPGERLLITGPTGSGKTTLLNLILGLDEGHTGAILLDGIDIREIALACLRKEIALVPQEPFLYSMSIRENVFAPLDLEELIETVTMTEEVERFDRGVETIVGERGVTLSGGQKQRLTLARALSIRPKMLLLDDPFTHVDGYTEHLIWEKIRPALDGKTVIIASSKAVPLSCVDRAAVLVAGEIADYGTPGELLGRNPYMKLLYEVKG
ncbi:MAG: ABC transporter ATP-binding protein, partial [Syntrophorhabdales bacterium]|jgi:ATP-binding cassette subfamily B protein